jgi:Tfp pilus assembly protein PilP
MSIKINILKILPILLILIFGFGCSDLMDKYGDMLPGFLKTEKKKEDPKTHKIKDKTPVKSSETEGEDTTPKEEGEEVTEKEPAEKAPEGDKTPKEKVTTPKEEDKTKPDLKETKKEEPTKEEEATTEDKKPETKDVTEEKPPIKKETTTDKPTKITSKDIAGEDVALVSISAKEGPPETETAAEDEDYFYDPRQKRDPFRPYNLKVEKKKETPPEELTPLQKYKLSQLNLKAIIYDSESDTGVAMVEDPTKKGFNIYVGTEIGEGRVVKITPDEVQVEMQYEDFYGNIEKRIETLKLSGVK